MKTFLWTVLALALTVNAMAAVVWACGHTEGTGTLGELVIVAPMLWGAWLCWVRVRQSGRRHAERP